MSYSCFFIRIVVIHNFFIVARVMSTAAPTLSPLWSFYPLSSSQMTAWCFLLNTEAQGWDIVVKMISWLWKHFASHSCCGVFAIHYINLSRKSSMNDLHVSARVFPCLFLLIMINCHLYPCSRSVFCLFQYCVKATFMLLCIITW